MDLSELERLERVTDQRMKLSEAIRIGAKIRPQCQGEYFEDGASCALGAAREAVGADTDMELHQRVNFYDENIYQEIIRRNDERGHTREQIADWLEGQGY